VLDADHPTLAGHDTRSILDAWVFSTGSAVVRDVMVGGHWVVRDGHHPHEERVQAASHRAVAAVTSRIRT
jgi:formimidoylglutamate deiminase